MNNALGHQGTLFMLSQVYFPTRQPVLSNLESLGTVGAEQMVKRD
jgi:hypothetical protein